MLTVSLTQACGIRYGKGFDDEAHKIAYIFFKGQKGRAFKQRKVQKQKDNHQQRMRVQFKKVLLYKNEEVPDEGLNYRKKKEMTGNDSNKTNRGCHFS